MYFFKQISSEADKLNSYFNETAKYTAKIILTSFLSLMAAVFQSAGGFLPGIGFTVSPITTAPIIISVIISYQLGFMSYIITIFLLLIIQPSELFIYPFSTGLLGLGIGIGFRLLKKRISIIILASFTLFIGILAVLYIVKFPILGPVSTNVNTYTLLLIYLFTIIYSWAWVEASLIMFKKLNKILYRGKNFK